MRNLIFSAGVLSIGLLASPGCEKGQAGAAPATCPAVVAAAAAPPTAPAAPTVDVTSHETMDRSVDVICAGPSPGAAERFRESIEFLRESFPAARENPAGYNRAEREAFQGKTAAAITDAAAARAVALFTPLRDEARVNLDAATKLQAPITKLQAEFVAGQALVAPYDLKVSVSDNWTLNFDGPVDETGSTVVTMRLSNRSAAPVQEVKFVVYPEAGPRTIDLRFDMPIPAGGSGTASLRHAVLLAPAMPKGFAAPRERFQKIVRSGNDNNDTATRDPRGHALLLDRRASFKTPARPAGNTEPEVIAAAVVEVLGPDGKSLAKSPAPPDAAVEAKSTKDVAERERQWGTYDVELAFWTGGKSTSSVVRQSRVDRHERVERACSVCDGAGRVACGSCAGLGMVPSVAAAPGTTRIGNMAICPSCGGTASLICGTCRGTGLKARPPG
ncbi:MAG: hypothetical protein JWO31_4264 [Phycisphaerales bacterium]|nr:hypothetical protein [Phycisphaerales bacterium]